MSLRAAWAATATAYDYSNILLLTLDGELVFALNEPAGSIGPTTHRAVKEAIAQQTPIISELFRGSDGSVHVDAVALVRDTSGQAVGAVVLRTSADVHLYPLLNYQHSPGSTVSSTLIRRDGENAVVLSSRRRTATDPPATNVPITRTEAAAVQVVLGERGQRVALDPDGRRILADLRSIPTTPWFLVTAISEDEVQSMIRARTGEIIAITGLIILLVGFVTAFGLRQRQAQEYRELYAAERRQREAQALFRTTIYSIGDAVITTDVDQRIVAMNPVAEQLTGWTEGAARGKALTEVYRSVAEDMAESRSEAPTPRPPTMTPTPAPAREIKALLTAAGGESRPIASVTTSITDDAGTNHGTVVVFRDQTRQREQQARLLQSERLASMGRMAGGIAHDFNNLLSVITGVAEVVSDQVADHAEIQSDLGELRVAADRAVALVRQLLTFSRQGTIRGQVVDLSAVVANLSRMLIRLLGVRVTLTVTQTCGAAMVLADPGQLEQVVMNLTLNARDAMPDGGAIAIDTDRRRFDEALVLASVTLPAGTYVVLSVRDTGTGMDAETATHIFEPFFTTKELGHGTGLGLATVHGIVQEAGGGISVTSLLGQGSTFTVYLPSAEGLADESSVPVA